MSERPATAAVRHQIERAAILTARSPWGSAEFSPEGPLFTTPVESLPSLEIIREHRRLEPRESRCRRSWYRAAVRSPLRIALRYSIPVSGSASPTRFALGRPTRIANPDRGGVRLDCFVDCRNQVGAYPVEIDFIAQPRLEGRKHPGGIVLVAVEAAVDENLQAATPRVEQAGDEKRGQSDRELRILTGYGAENRLEDDYAAEIKQRHGGGEGGVDNRAVDQDIDVPQALAQDGEGNRDRDREHDEAQTRLERYIPGGRFGRDAYKAVDEDEDDKADE